MVRLYVFSVFCSISDSILLANHGFLENCFFELTCRNSWCHIIFSSVQNFLLLYHLFPLLIIARSAGDLPFSPTEPLTTLFHSVLCSWERLVHMSCNNGFPCPPSSCWVWLLVRSVARKRQSWGIYFPLDVLFIFVRTWTDNQAGCIFLCLNIFLKYVINNFYSMLCSMKGLAYFKAMHQLYKTK